MPKHLFSIFYSLSVTKPANPIPVMIVIMHTFLKTAAKSIAAEPTYTIFRIVVIELKMILRFIFIVEHPVTGSKYAFEVHRDVGPQKIIRSYAAVCRFYLLSIRTTHVRRFWVLQHSQVRNWRVFARVLGPTNAAIHYPCIWKIMLVLRCSV